MVCRNICEGIYSKIVVGESHYFSGKTYCRRCECYFITTKIFCQCCGMQLRTTPAERECKVRVNGKRKRKLSVALSFNILWSVVGQSINVVKYIFNIALFVI